MFFRLFRTSFHIIGAKYTSESAILYSLALLNLKLKHHLMKNAVTMTSKTWEFEECSQTRKRSVFGSRIDLNLQKPEGLFSRR